jgi:hypothetical protein
MWISSISDTRRDFVFAAVAVSIWLTVVIVGMAVLNGKANAPSNPAVSPLAWPTQSKIPRSGNFPTVLMFAHPHCPCTRATFGELELVLTRFSGRIDAHVVFINPTASGEDWTWTSLWRKASVIPGIAVHSDDDGTEARLFHSRTSGQVIAYDRNGRLVFEGGITAARGHSGDNPGRSALEAVLEGKLTGVMKPAVFGCPLFDENCREGGTEFITRK